MTVFSRYNRVAGAAALLTAFVACDYKLATREAVAYAQQRSVYTGESVEDALTANFLERRSGQNLAFGASVVSFVGALLAVRFEAPELVIFALGVFPSVLLMSANACEAVLRRRLP